MFLDLLHADDPPVLTYRFPENTVEPGVPVSLKCTATGTPLPQITWSLDGSPVIENLRLRIGDFVTNDGYVNSFVNITSATTEDGGRYECHASNDVESVVHGARLNVRGPPFVRAMGNASVLAGSTLIVTCPAAGYPIAQILWYKGEHRELRCIILTMFNTVKSPFSTVSCFDNMNLQYAAAVYYIIANTKHFSLSLIFLSLGRASEGKRQAY